MRKAVVGLLALMMFVAGCGSAAKYKALSLPDEKRLTVVATAYPLFEAAAGIGGQRVHASNLLPLDPFAGLDADQTQKLIDADLVVTLGKGAQPNVDAALEKRTKPVIDVLDLFPTQMLPGTKGEVDPYVWENPLNMVIIQQKIRDTYELLDSGGTSMYAEYTKNLSADTKNLDGRIERSLKTCKSTNFVTEDNRFSYLSSRYGLNQVYVNTNGGKSLADPLQQAINKYKPSTIFQVTLPSLDGAKSIHDHYGVLVSTMDPAIAQTDQARRGGANFSGFMTLNLEALQGALDCTN